MKKEDYQFLGRVIGGVELERLEIQIFDAVSYSIDALEEVKGRGFIRSDRKREALIIESLRNNYLSNLCFQLRALMKQHRVDESGLSQMIEFQETSAEEMKQHYRNEMTELLKQQNKDKPKTNP